MFTGLGPYVVEGRVESQYGAVTVNVESCTRLAPLGLTAGRPAEAPRRPAGEPRDQEVVIVEKSW